MTKQGATAAVIDAPRWGWILKSWVRNLKVWQLESEAWNLKPEIWIMESDRLLVLCVAAEIWCNVDPVEPNSIRTNLISLLSRILVTWCHDRLILSRLLHLVPRSNLTRSFGRHDSFEESSFAPYIFSNSRYTAIGRTLTRKKLRPSKSIFSSAQKKIKYIS